MHRTFPGIPSWLSAGVLLALSTASEANAQAYPVKPLRMVIPFAPGGTTDIIARLLGHGISEALGQQVVMDNRGGAGGTVGTDLAAKSAPDGHTLLINNISLAINDALYPKLPYDTRRDLAPVSLIGTTPNLFVVHPSLPAKSVKDFLVIARSRPGQLAYASGGVGSSSHLATELLQALSGTRFVHVPYRGAGGALADLAAGQVQFMINSMPALLPSAKGGRLRPIAVSGARRSPALPELPTIAEGGVETYEYATWYGLLLPASTPKAIVGRLNEVVVKAVNAPDLRERLAQQGVEPDGTTPERFGEIISADMTKWRKIIREANMRPE